MEFIASVVIWTLSLYGLFEIIKNIIYISTYTKFKADGIYVIIAVKNQEERIEGFLRAILFKIIYGREEFLKNIKIAKKLSKEYDCLKVLNWKECKEIIDDVDNT